MGQTAPSYPGEQRRRSTRITQSVPLTVRGVDLLGQPFEERTSTLVLNHHGCKYPSKHHLPKNTWLTLEIQHADSEHGRHCVRARVAWIQRPRTVRELFQIGVELENPDNVWEIASPPEDWTEQPETAPSAAVRGTFSTRAGEESGLTGLEPPGAASLPGPVAVYIERMLHDAKLHSRGAPTGTAASPSLDEGSPFLHELSAQLEHQAERAVEAAATQARQSLRRTADEIERERRANDEALHRKWKQEFEEWRKEAAEQLAVQLSSQVNEAQQSERARFSKELETSLSEARELLSELVSRAETLHNEIESAAQSTATRFEQLRSGMAAAEAAIRQHPAAQEALQAVDEKAVAAWKERLESEAKLALAQWNELLQSSIDSAAQRLVSRMADSSMSAVAGAEQKMAARLSELSQPIAQTAAEAQEALTGVRGALEQEVARARSSLVEIEQAANRMSEYSAQLDAASQDTVNELHRRLESILASQTAELNRRAESLAARLADRLGSMLESTGQQFVTRTLADLETKFDSQIERAQDSLRQLAAREEQAEETLRVHRERLRQATEQNQREAAIQMGASLAQLQNNFEGARREALVKWNDELEQSGIRATHGALESLTKASSWYQQKTQDDVQAIIDEALQRAASKLAEMTAEAGQRHTAELDEQHSRQAERARETLDQVASESVGRARAQFEQAAESTSKAFGSVLDGISDQAVQRFTETSLHTLDGRTTQLRNLAEEIRRNLQGEAVRVLAEQQKELTEQLDLCSGEARKALEGQLASTMEAFRILRDGQQREWLATLEHLSSESTSQYEEKLRSLRESWMVGSVRKLSEHGQDALESLTRTAEQTLRATCSRVFDGLAEVMREKMLGATGSAAAKTAAASSGETPTTEKQSRR